MKNEEGCHFVLNEFLLDVIYRSEFEESLPQIQMELSKIVGKSLGTFLLSMIFL
jgi:hypothetical protein